jgi:hypothetical protein
MRATRCGGCNNQGLAERDGREIGGLPGVTYQYCNACGWSRAITTTGGRRSPPVRECGACGHSMRMMKFANETKRRLTCPDCGWRPSATPQASVGPSAGNASSTEPPTQRGD